MDEFEKLEKILTIYERVQESNVKTAKIMHNMHLHRLELAERAFKMQGNTDFFSEFNAKLREVNINPTDPPVDPMPEPTPEPTPEPPKEEAPKPTREQQVIGNMKSFLEVVLHRQQKTAEMHKTLMDATMESNKKIYEFYKQVQEDLKPQDLNKVQNKF